MADAAQADAEVAQEFREYLKELEDPKANEIRWLTQMVNDQSDYAYTISNVLKEFISKVSLHTSQRPQCSTADNSTGARQPEARRPLRIGLHRQESRKYLHPAPVQGPLRHVLGCIHAG